MTQPKSNIGQEWKAFRSRNLFTQQALAQTLGISKRQVQNIEWGVNIPRYSTQRRFNALKSKHERDDA